MVHFCKPWFVNNVGDVETYIKNSFEQYDNSEILVIGKRVMRGLFGSSNELDSKAISIWLGKITFPARICVREGGMMTNANILQMNKPFPEDKWLFSISKYEPYDFPYIENDINDYDSSWGAIELNQLLEISNMIEIGKGIEFIVWNSTNICRGVLPNPALCDNKKFMLDMNLEGICWGRHVYWHRKSACAGSIKNNYKSFENFWAAFLHQGSGQFCVTHRRKSDIMANSKSIIDGLIMNAGPGPFPSQPKADVGVCRRLVYPTLMEEIKGRQEDFMRAFNAGDSKGTAEMYDTNGYFMPNDHPPVNDRKGMLKLFQKDMTEGVTNIQIVTEEVNGSGDWAFVRGKSHMKCTRCHESCAFLQVWKKVNGVWLIHNECFNAMQ